MENRKIKFRSDYAALGAAGLGLGWLMGLSVSPVLMTVVTGLVGVVGGVISALAGLGTLVTGAGSRGVSRSIALELPQRPSRIVKDPCEGLLCRAVRFEEACILRVPHVPEYDGGFE